MPPLLGQPLPLLMPRRDAATTADRIPSGTTGTFARVGMAAIRDLGRRGFHQVRVLDRGAIRKLIVETVARRVQRALEAEERQLEHGVREDALRLAGALDRKRRELKDLRAKRRSLGEKLLKERDRRRHAELDRDRSRVAIVALEAAVTRLTREGDALAKRASALRDSRDELREQVEQVAAAARAGASNRQRTIEAMEQAQSDLVRAATKKAETIASESAATQARYQELGQSHDELQSAHGRLQEAHQRLHEAHQTLTEGLDATKAKPLPAPVRLRPRSDRGELPTDVSRMSLGFGNHHRFFRLDDRAHTPAGVSASRSHRSSAPGLSASGSSPPAPIIGPPPGVWLESISKAVSLAVHDALSKGSLPNRGEGGAIERLELRLVAAIGRVETRLDEGAISPTAGAAARVSGAAGVVAVTAKTAALQGSDPERGAVLQGLFRANLALQKPEKAKARDRAAHEQAERAQQARRARTRGAKRVRSKGSDPAVGGTGSIPTPFGRSKG